jgi:hypothetical protein
MPYKVLPIVSKSAFMVKYVSDNVDVQGWQRRFIYRHKDDLNNKQYNKCNPPFKKNTLFPRFIKPRVVNEIEHMYKPFVEVMKLYGPEAIAAKKNKEKGSISNMVLVKNTISTNLITGISVGSSGFVLIILIVLILYLGHKYEWFDDCCTSKIRINID